MGGDTYLQFLLIIESFAAGVLAVIGVRYVRAHYQTKRDTKTHTTEQNESPQPNMPLIVDEKFKAIGQQKFNDVLMQAVAQFEQDLRTSSEKINQLVMQLATNIVGDEMQQYQSHLRQLGEKANAEMSTIRQELLKHQDELKAKQAQEFEKEKQFLMRQIDSKLADALGSFLSDTLGHNVDLGNQQAYLLDMLEQHKQDFKQEVVDESRPSQ